MLHQIREHPVYALAALLVAAFGCFLLSASGQPGAGWEDGPHWLGNVAWFAFLLCALAFLVLAALTVVRSVRDRSAA
ncbi:MAG TPA: hypothetical protein VFG63_06820 [Nocardioidaceae bacterium]|nr:hypothetical protein [Nocardioidaceae bacterium]